MKTVCLGNNDIKVKGKEMGKLLLSGLGVWLVFIVIAIINAGARENLYGPHMSELRAHQLSSIIFIILIFILTFLFMKLGNFSLEAKNYILLGIMWPVLTIFFEFLAGHFLFGNSWEKLFADYNILQGRLWSFVLMAIALAPLIAGKLTE